jgi:thiol-disulfide isomerase/thioredoxin
MTARVRAPELRGRGWRNTDEPLRLSALRGRWVLLDFWTAGCVNCLHVLDELRPLEAELGDAVVVVGVHTPKFEHEATPDALTAAVARMGVTHPVLDDADRATWEAYTVRAWPTLVLVDPDGYIVAQRAGEGHVADLRTLLADVVAAPTSPAAPHHGDGLRFPSAVTSLPGGRLLVANSGQHRLVELDGDAVVRRIGGGARGLVDGPAEQASFADPHRVLLLPGAVTHLVGYDAVVADSGNHALRGLRLADGHVRTLAGDGHPWRPGDGTQRLSSPWDLAWWHGRVWIAMAGVHQLWSLDPVTGELRVEAGTGREGLVDGPSAEAWFAQPSGLVADGDSLWVVDAESSALRRLRDGRVATEVGAGLFDFGFVDGAPERARLQHPQAAALLPDGGVAVADTYNGAVRRWDPGARGLTTMVTGLAEPTGVAVDGDHLVVVESAAHRVTAVALDARDGAPTAAVSPAEAVREVRTTLDLVVSFAPPAGEQLDERAGPATRLHVQATPAQLLRAGHGSGAGLTRRLEIDPRVGDGYLLIAASAGTCDEEDRDGAACRLHRADWSLPVRVADTSAATGTDRLELRLEPAVSVPVAGPAELGHG